MFVAFAAVIPAISQSLSDYEAAVNAAKSGKGCESIPFSSMKSRCIDLNSIKDSYCKNDNNDWNEMDPRKLQNTINNINRNISDLKSKRNDLQNKLSSANGSDKDDMQKQINDLDNQIKDQEYKVSDFTSRMEQEKRDINNLIDPAQRCLDARLKEQELFNEAIREASNETDPAKKEKAQFLIDYWKSNISGHQTQINLVRDRINRYKEMLSN